MYTNHSIRVTGVTILTRMKFIASEIMSVTGHKSVQSLTIYQRTQYKKIEMGNVMDLCMTRAEEEVKHQIQGRPEPCAIEYSNPEVAVVKEKPNVSSANAIIPFESDMDTNQEVPDFDLMALMNDIKREQERAPVLNTTTSNILNNIPKSMFSNCTIQNSCLISTNRH